MALTRVSLLAPNSVGNRILSAGEITSDKFGQLTSLTISGSGLLTGSITCFEQISSKGAVYGSNVLSEERLTERIFTASVIFG